MKKWITLNLCLLLSGFLAGQSENKETQPVKAMKSTASSPANTPARYIL